MNKIGVSTVVNTGRENYERMLDLINAGFKHLELYNKSTRIRLSDVIPLKELIKAKNISFSFHSMVKDLFCIDKDIARQEYYTLKGEIKLASLIGCSNVIFHIGNKSELNKKQIKKLKNLVSFAKKLDLVLALENNSSKIMAGNYLLTLKKIITNLKFCLDIGHLKIAFNNKLIKDLDLFVKELSLDIVQLHISHNNGEKDEHKELNKNSFVFFKRLIGLIQNKKIIYVIETKTLNQAKKTLKLIKNS